MMIKNTFSAIWMLCFVLCTVQTTRACFCGYSTLQGSFMGSDAVFVGKVVRIQNAREASVGLVMKESGTRELLKTPDGERSFQTCDE